MSETPSRSPRDDIRLIAQALRDIDDLLEYLSAMEDGRLQSHFKDLRTQTANATPMRAVPPVENYGPFLQRLDGIRRVFQTTGNLPDPGIDSPLSDTAFVLWARDFLASVAAPVTADSIRVTRFYVSVRARSVCDRMKSIFAMCVGTKPEDDAAYSVERRAINLAHSVMWLNGFVLLAVVLSTMLSIYALAGQWIAKGREEAITNIRQINTTLVDLETKVGEGVRLNPALAGRPKGFVSICDNVELINADHGDLYRNGPSFGPIPNNVLVAHVSPQALDLCRQRRRALTQLFAIGEQMLAWQRATTEAVLIGPIIAPLFGRSASLTSEMAADPLICRHFTGKRTRASKLTVGQPAAGGDAATVPQQEHLWDVKECAISLQQLVEYYGKIPDAILGCVSLYILPIMYGWLGAGVSAMRRIRTRVDGTLLVANDRGSILQSNVLGVAVGAVIGLFANYITKSSGVETIGLSALAFLAGYNVSGLFRLLDALSARLFNAGPAQTSSTAAR